VRYLPLVAYIATIFAANWAISVYGLVPVGFGLLAPSGVYFAGLAFTLRDLTQENLGRVWTVLAIAVGAVLSAAISAQFALASGTAFLVSEMADFLVYTPLRERRWLPAVAASNTVGLIVDSALFLSLAFGSLEFLSGQVVGKAWMTLLAVAVLWLLRRRGAALGELRLEARSSKAASDVRTPNVTAAATEPDAVKR
jgi:queuosine precursor transporter